jgi:hypothetical protein
MSSFIVDHLQVMEILAHAVLTTHPQLDPNTTRFELIMTRKKISGNLAEVVLLVTTEDRDKKPKKQSLWDRIKTMVQLKPLREAYE